MHLDKAKKRIAKHLKRGFNGYPQVTLAYFGPTPDSASEVLISFILDADTAPQEQKFTSEGDAREDESIQSMLVKIIERANAKTVMEVDGVAGIAALKGS